VDRWVKHWAHFPAVRCRLEAISEATATAALFMEHTPDTVDSWLIAQTAAGAPGVDDAYAMVERELLAGVAFMGEQGLQHFGAHFRNLLTDGERLYFADFGLACTPASH
jgi:tRNA A-37 threonylcarbamoyl transferase component Bud32